MAVDPADIEAKVAALRSLGIEVLRRRWRAMFDAKPPAALTKDLMRRMIAYRIQEEAYGGLDKAAVSLLDRLAHGKKPGSVLTRRLKPGTVVVREYQGIRHTVTIAPDGFLWEGRTYASLSIIARAITGTAWNGPRFFGLRAPDARPKGGEGTTEPPASPKPQGRRSSSVVATGTSSIGLATSPAPFCEPPTTAAWREPPDVGAARE